MRFQRTAALLGLVVLWLALGPWVFLVALGLLFVARVRDWLRPTRRVGGILVAVAAAVTGLVLVIPDGWLPLPPGPGALVTPGYVGRPAVARPVAAAARRGRRRGQLPVGRAAGGVAPGRHRVVRPRAVRRPGVRRARPAGRAVRRPVAGVAGHRPRLDAVAGRQGAPRPARGRRHRGVGGAVRPGVVPRRRGPRRRGDHRPARAGRRHRRRRGRPRPHHGREPRPVRAGAGRRLPGGAAAGRARRPSGSPAGTGASARSTRGPPGSRCWTSARTSPTRSPSTATACTS